MTDTVLVDNGIDKPFEGIVMGFAGTRAKIEWTEKVKKWGVTKTIHRSQYFKRANLTVVSFEGDDMPDKISELVEEILKLGWYQLSEGRWTHGENKKFPAQGKVGTEDGFLSEEIKAENLEGFLLIGLDKLRNTA